MFMGTSASRRRAPQLQVPLVARPRNQSYLQGKVVGFRRPFPLYGRPEHGRQVASRLDAEFLQQPESRIEATEALRGACHLRMQKRWRFVSRGDLCLKRFASQRVRLQLVLDLTSGHAVHDGLNE